MFAPVVAAERWTRAQVFSFQIGHSQWGTKPTRAKNAEEALSRVGSSTDDWHKRRASQLLNMRIALLLDRLQRIAEGNAEIRLRQASRKGRKRWTNHVA